MYCERSIRKTALMMLLMIFFPLVLSAGTTKQKVKNMRSIILRYAKSTDTRDVEALEEVFHENFKVNAITKDGMRTMDKTQYLSLMKAGKIGGTERKMKILSIEDDGIIGIVKLTLGSSEAVFHDHITLVKEKGEWQIISNTTRLVSKSH